MAGRIARWGVAGGLALVWWWAVLRLAFTPAAGPLEGAVAAGGWGLSLLPVHCVPKARATGAVPAGSWRQAWRAGVRAAGAAEGPGGGPVGDGTAPRSPGAGGGCGRRTGGGSGLS